MPYKDPEKQREASRENMRKLRARRRVGRPPLSGKKAGDKPRSVKAPKVEKLAAKYNLDTLDGARGLLKDHVLGKVMLTDLQVKTLTAVLDSWRKDGTADTEGVAQRMLLQIQPLPIECPKCGASFEA